MIGAAFLYAAVACCTAAVMWRYRDLVGGTIVLYAVWIKARAAYKARYWITAFLLFYFRQYVAAVWITCHSIDLHGRAALYYRKHVKGISETLDIINNVQFAAYCAGHLQAADNDEYTAEYIRFARAGYTVVDLALIDIVPSEGRKSIATQHSKEWISTETLRVMRTIGTDDAAQVCRKY